MKFVDKIQGRIKRILLERYNNLYILRKIQVYVNNFQSIFNKNTINFDIFDYEDLIKRRKVYSKEVLLLNTSYGISRNVKFYSDYENAIYAGIEHGVYFGSMIANDSQKSGLPGVITFSMNRVNYIRRHVNKPILAIGPYIHYASYLLNESERDTLKKRLGKTLLVFPVHSTDDWREDYDIENFINYIEKFRKQYVFDTVLICMYWKDIESKKHVPYVNNGFFIITAGHRYNPYFLNRLKSIIYLADYTLSNSVGTHVGYCVYLNKPHHIYKQNVETISEMKVAPKSISQEREWECNDVYNAFEEVVFQITQKQYEVCNKYWGFDNIKSKEEIRIYLQKCDEVFLKAKRKTEEEYEKYYEHYFLDHNI